MPDTPAQAGPPCEIEFWFEFGSPYSYLSMMRVEDAAREHRVRIIWKPFLLGPIFPALGFETSPFLLHKEKGDYVQQDMTRQCGVSGARRKPDRESVRSAALGREPTAFIAMTARTVNRRTRDVEFARDSLLEEDGFELVVRGRREFGLVPIPNRRRDGCASPNAAWDDFEIAHQLGRSTSRPLMAQDPR